MTDPIPFWTLVLTFITTVITLVGVIYAVLTLREGVRQGKRNAEVVWGQFWVSTWTLFAKYDDVHAMLRPGGIWGVQSGERYSPRGPTTAAEWSRVELYMGNFERCEALIVRELLKEEDFRSAFAYRLHNLVSNKIIVREKLLYRKEYWEKFCDLCERLEVHIPSFAEINEAGE
jgi:hypothetical protein